MPDIDSACFWLLGEQKTRFWDFVLACRCLPFYPLPGVLSYDHICNIFFTFDKMIFFIYIGGNQGCWGIRTVLKGSNSQHWIYPMLFIPRGTIIPIKIYNNLHGVAVTFVSMKTLKLHWLVSWICTFAIFPFFSQFLCDRNHGSFK